MAQKDDFFFEANSVEDITEADYQRAMPYVEAAQAFAQTTYQSIYIIDYHRKNFLYVSDNPLFLCRYSAEEVRQIFQNSTRRASPKLWPTSPITDCSDFPTLILFRIRNSNIKL
jgi:hypothetical protein